jgi:beta-lactam-binding protein with PASTA domain
MFKGFFQFIKSKTFFKHLLIYMALLALICWLIIVWLGTITNHGQTVVVPNFVGLKTNDLDKFLSDKIVKYEIIDSVYDKESPKGIVIRQEPEASETVKEGRTVYLYVTSILPPSIQMPKLVDHSLRQATAMIESFDLKLGKTRFVPDECANCILEQLVKGKKIAPGELVP